MRWSKYLIPTLKEEPTEAEVVSHKLMLRAGMIRKLSSGIYNFLPLGYRVIKKIENIVREEMNRAGAIELLMPAIQPAELWQESGRWEQYGKELLRIKDRNNRDFCFGPTHEEVITDLVRKEVKSYRQLPLNLYQIQTKFRDEIRPRFGVMRAREFSMKDAYSFDADNEGAEKTYRKMHEAYSRIFERCGLRFRAVEAETGTIGGSFSHEFMVLADTGEEIIASCDKCSYAANIERAEVGEEEGKRQKAKGKSEESGVKSTEDEKLETRNLKLETLKIVETPGLKSVEEVAGFLKCEKSNLVKTLIYVADSKPVAVLVKGDCEVNDFKLKKILNCKEINLASDEMVKKATKSPKGFAGPVGLSGIRIIADRSVKGMANFVTGANSPDKHYINVNLGRDFNIDTFYDLRNTRENDPCPRCHGKLIFTRGIEVGHIFKLGTKYSESLKAIFLDSEGKECLMIMGCYGIGVSRTMAAAIEQNHDTDGIIWPLPIAPFKVIILPLNMNHKETVEVSEKIYNEFLEKGVDVLIDDRDDRPGVKFKDSDLIGIPIRVTVGEKVLKEGKLEIRDRRSKEVRKISKDNILQEVLKIIST
ncbi:MAG: proline--tRNA ligase [Candidatus Schekmanbacteria bacterium RIFCSPHIGHO2_02_FULL_38_11]|uniref:Proline--tRNA ligase n=1 Tax=Candidatus Schekmanbacteria bacterium RIFCSPLOWO2_12_FULL_38_15 TaxID=1817883 RepID=A0A1F7SJG7_9BACT|nr:MAG: proline--tRNA ligase [Candidatus Schekmanbacteria bacterium RIFCSPLOWO2_02_FULL_38_14]OGL53364.1 MAG: proline--tRNA ligase [Candidatus Schekmanbacteria bacterium RIFCSPLOWO2_12_FULL_38_15]OGL55718.1 MAG: proline--tRNA ligase [Candidatus Schekmanbacteria bacterium RIFCSPHIGHO2_02_FULL_38_11]